MAKDRWTRQPVLVEGPLVALGIALATVTVAAPLGAQQLDRTRDRGPGIPVSMFGTYIEPGEIILYPFFEYYYDNDAEYSPQELGYGLDRDFRGEYRASEALVFLGYGISDRLAFEFEVAVISARQDKSHKDPTDMPERIEESGLGDVEGQLRYRWRRESEGGPGIFSYFETVFPLQKDKVLIGTQGWEFKLGTGFERGFRFGTMTLRLSVAYDEAEKKGEIGEYALEYVRRLKPWLGLYLGMEGSEDELEIIADTQWSLARNVILKLNSAFGATSKATGWAPEVGLMFRFR